MNSTDVKSKPKRKPIPAVHCDYLMRMHLKSIENISHYMAGGCGDGVLNGPLMVCVGLIELRKVVDKTLKEYSV